MQKQKYLATAGRKPKGSKLFRAIKLNQLVCCCHENGNISVNINSVSTSLSKNSYLKPNFCQKSNNKKLHTEPTMPKSPNLFLTLVQKNYSLARTLFIITSIAILNVQTIRCSIAPLDSQMTSKECNNLDADSNMNQQEIIEPMIVINSQLGTKESTLSTLLTPSTGCPDNLNISFSGFGDRIVIDLDKNKRLISDRYFKISKEDNATRHGRHPDSTSIDSEFYQNHLFLNLHNFTTNNDHCHYHGFVNGNVSLISAISVVDYKLLSGFFQSENYVYYLHANTTNCFTTLTRSSSKDSCIPNNSRSKHGSEINDRKNLRRLPRAASSSKNFVRHEPYQSSTDSFYVELLVVHDNSQFIEYKGNTTLIAERTMQIVNIMNAFYRQLNIFIALVGVVLWTEKDAIELTEDGDSTLTNFLKYRYEKLLPNYHHDNAQLITSTSFNGSVVGKALKGPICTHEHSGGVNTAHSHSPAVVAVTLAHELGHNFGMEHDEEDKCKCPDEKCIMSSSSSTVHPKHWSSCSIEYLEDAKKHGYLDCLANKPEKVFGPTCGNGFVEDGEDCDLGEPIPTYGTSKSRKSAMVAPKCARGQECDQVSFVNPCCDKQTCKFVVNATCAQGPCCDLTKCSVFNTTESRVCRQRKTECDLEEFCDGESEYCPPDVHYHDGIECGPTAMPAGRISRPIVDPSIYNRNRAYCYNGKCSSHESQCQLLWGPSGSVSKDICYEQNIHGNTSGNCGYNRREKAYETCEPEDAVCGMLHCVHNQQSVGDSRKTGKLQYGFESGSILTVSFFVMSNHAKIYCHGAIIDAGPSVRDPGLVPDGAACGQDRMCLNQRCVPVYDVVYKDWCPSDCNGNGICDNLGVCHCNDGTIGTSCYQFFGSNFHLSLVLYIIMFFVPLIALIVYTINHYRKQIKIWWFLHNRKIALRQKGRDPNHQQRRMTYEVDRNKISISEPIPLNQHNNTNRPFYEPNTADPWAETNCETGKSPAYKLPPLGEQPPGSQVVPSAKKTTTNQISTKATNSLRPVRAAPPPPTAR